MVHLLKTEAGTAPAAPPAGPTTAHDMRRQPHARRRRGKARASTEHAHPTAPHHGLVRAHRVTSRDDAAKLIGLLRARRSTAQQLSSAQAAAGSGISAAGTATSPATSATTTPLSSTQPRPLERAGSQVLSPHKASGAGVGRDPAAAAPTRSSGQEGLASAGSATPPARAAPPAGLPGSAEDDELAFYRTLMARGPPPRRPARRSGPAAPVASAQSRSRPPRRRAPADGADAVAEYGEEMDPTGARPPALARLHALDTPAIAQA